MEDNQAQGVIISTADVEVMTNALRKSAVEMWEGLLVKMEEWINRPYE